MREAFSSLYLLTESNSKSFTRIAGLHGLPSPSYCNHGGTSGFLSWHRAYLLELENALREYKCNVTIPFWDWNSTPNNGIPEACKNPTYVNRNGATVDNPLYRGPIAPSAGSGFSTRRSDINSVSFQDLAISANTNQTEINFNNYANTLNGLHGSVHVRFSGSMSSVAYAAFDPIFFFHHANVDRLWANWQTNIGNSPTSSELNASLQPFTKPLSNSWLLGSDVQNISELNYSYRNWCFIWPPIFWPHLELIKIPIEPWILNSNRISFVLESEEMLMESVEIRVFLNDEKANPNSKLTNNENYLGSIGIFGMGKAHGQSIHGSQSQTFKLDITKRIQQIASKSKNKNLNLKLIPVTGNSEQYNTNNAQKMAISIETT